MNLRVQQNVGKFLSSCTTGSFSRRVQLHGVSLPVFNFFSLASSYLWSLAVSTLGRCGNYMEQLHNMLTKYLISFSNTYSTLSIDTFNIKFAFYQYLVDSAQMWHTFVIWEVLTHPELHGWQLDFNSWATVRVLKTCSPWWGTHPPPPPDTQTHTNMTLWCIADQA
jgi:hypothetical protein